MSLESLENRVLELEKKKYANSEWSTEMKMNVQQITKTCRDHRSMIADRMDTLFEKVSNLESLLAECRLENSKTRMMALGVAFVITLLINFGYIFVEHLLNK